MSLSQVDHLDRHGFVRRLDPAIAVLQSHRVQQFSMLSLDASSAYALASLVADHGDEDLAERLLQAVDAVAPELTGWPP